MLSLFPQLLFLAPLGTTLVRIAAGICVLYIGYRVVTEKDLYAQEHFPIVGHPAAWMLWIAAVITLVTGALITIGLYTQGAAILGALIGIKIAIFNRRYAALMPISASAALLLTAICLSLLISGAGAFAFDLPL